MRSVPREQIVRGIREAGVQPGDLLLAHSSLSSFGHVQGGAAEAAWALVDSVMPGGCAFVPTFNFGRGIYDPATTPSATGAVTEAFRHLPGAVRSLHPTHSVAALGTQGATILAGHENCHAFGPGSPLWRLYENNAWVLLIGCDHRSSSMIHVAEEVAGMPYVDRTRTAMVKSGDTVQEWTGRKPGCSRGFSAIDGPLRSAGAIREGLAGGACLQLMRAKDVVDIALAMLNDDPGALLCSIADCQACAQARQVLESIKV